MFLLVVLSVVMHMRTNSFTNSLRRLNVRSSTMVGWFVKVVDNYLANILSLTSFEWILSFHFI